MRSTPGSEFFANHLDGITTRCDYHAMPPKKTLVECMKCHGEGSVALSPPMQEAYDIVRKHPGKTARQMFDRENLTVEFGTFLMRMQRLHDRKAILRTAITNNEYEYRIKP